MRVGGKQRGREKREKCLSEKERKTASETDRRK